MHRDVVRSRCNRESRWRQGRSRWEGFRVCDVWRHHQMATAYPGSSADPRLRRRGSCADRASTYHPGCGTLAKHRGRSRARQLHCRCPPFLVCASHPSIRKMGRAGFGGHLPGPSGHLVKELGLTNCGKQGWLGWLGYQDGLDTLMTISQKE